MNPNCHCEMLLNVGKYRVILCKIILISSLQIVLFSFDFLFPNSHFLSLVTLFYRDHSIHKVYIAKITMIWKKILIDIK